MPHTRTAMPNDVQLVVGELDSCKEKWTKALEKVTIILPPRGLV